MKNFNLSLLKSTFSATFRLLGINSIIALVEK